jgi:pimeloyl-ACP methyl ester carboxylesterase
MSDAGFKQMATGMSQGMSVNPDAQQQIVSWIFQADRKTYVYGYTDYLKLDVRENLKNITAPVTILAAAQPYGEEIIRKTLTTQYENLKNYKLEVAPGAAHFIMLDDPTWFNEKLMQELRAHD